MQGIGRRLHARLIAALGPEREARCAGRLERIDHVHVVRPGLRPVLPGVHGGVRADEVTLPAQRRPVPVVPLERRLVIGPLVAEGGAESLQQGTVGNQTVPEVMADLVTEVPQKSAVRLFLQGAFLLPVDVVGLRDIEGDQSVVVTGQHSLRVAVGVILEEFEGESLRVILALRDHRQAKTQQGIQHAPFCDLEAEPGDGVAIGG